MDENDETTRFSSLDCYEELKPRIDKVKSKETVFQIDGRHHKLEIRLSEKRELNDEIEELLQ